jgi:hypothetical protein
MGRASSTHGEKMNLNRLFVGKSEGKRQLATPGHKEDGDIKMNIG